MQQKLTLQAKLQQKLILTPSLQQAIKLLPMSTLELADMLQQEITENPLLEERGEQIISRVDAGLDRATNEYFSEGMLAAAWMTLLLDRVSDATRIMERLDSRDAALAPASWPVHALFAEKTGNHQDAQKWLQQCFDRYPQLLVDKRFWCNGLLMSLRLRTAERLMTGSTARSDAILHEAARHAQENIQHG